MGSYRVTAGYVTVETAVPGGRASVDIGRGALLPDGVSAEDLQRAIELGQVAAVEPTAPEPQPEPDEVPAGTVAEVLAWVGDDKDRAARALDVEQAEGGAGRKGVVDPLTDLLTRPE